MLIGSYVDTPNLEESDSEIDSSGSDEGEKAGIIKTIWLKWSRHKGKLYYDIKSDHNLKDIVKIEFIQSKLCNKFW